MTEFAPEVESRIAQVEERRRAEIREIERLWMRLGTLRGEKVNFRMLDKKINDWFHVSDGRDSLSFESIEKVKRSLEKSILKEEKQENGN